MITMEPTEFVPMSGSNLICTVTVALETAPDTNREEIMLTARSPFQGAKIANISPAVADELPGYGLSFVAEPTLPEWAIALGAEPAQVHGSTGRRVWVLVREPGPPH